MIAHDLKNIADKANEEKNDPQIKSGYHFMIKALTNLAEQGKYGHSFDLSFLNVSLPIWHKIADLLREDGFRVHFETEIMQWYSNTDFDEKSVVKISWL